MNIFKWFKSDNAEKAGRYVKKSGFISLKKGDGELRTGFIYLYNGGLCIVEDYNGRLYQAQPHSLYNNYYTILDSPYINEFIVP